MQLPPIWRGRGPHVSARSRLAQFRAVLHTAQSIDIYRDRLAKAGLVNRDGIARLGNVEEAIYRMEPIALNAYNTRFSKRQPARRYVPQKTETRSAFLLPYSQARSGYKNYHEMLDDGADLYSPERTGKATEDLYNLARALNTPPVPDLNIHQALVVFSGIDAGLVSQSQRKEMWERYQVPFFEHFLGMDGAVIASECEVHAGLHIRQDTALLECIDGELIITSLTDRQSPALRLRSGLCATIDAEPCECGRLEPRLTDLDILQEARSARAA